MAVTSQSRLLPLDVRDGLYLVLTSGDVRVQDFYRAECGFHYFTFPNIVSTTVPYAWVGYSGSQRPWKCSYPLAWQRYSRRPLPSGDGILKAPNGDAGVDGMISVITHELAEASTNPLVNAWYAREDPTSPSEVTDLCVVAYGSGAGGGYIGAVNKDRWGDGFNLNGVNGRKFLVQCVWSPVKSRCYGLNAN